MPRLIDDETFYKVQEMLKINKRAPAHKWSRVEYLLTDKLFCGKCGSLMAGESGISHTGAKHSYYLCTKHMVTRVTRLTGFIPLCVANSKIYKYIKKV